MYKMSDRFCIAVSVLLFTSSAVTASEIGHEIADRVSIVSYRHYLDDVLYTHLGDNRGPSGPEHVLARDAIATILESLGYAVDWHAFEYRGETHYNIVGTKVGFMYPDEKYIVGAHFDSADNPGADDDASGVAGLLELARIYSQYDTQYTVKFIAFDLEEEGRVGSKAYVYDHLDDDIRGMVQLDMLAWDHGENTASIEAAHSDTLQNAVADAVAEYGQGLLSIVRPPGLGSSDHQAFEDAGFQACLVIEHRYTANPCAHQPCDAVDTPDYIDYEFAVNFVRSAAGFLADNARAHYAGDCNGDGLPDKLQIRKNPGLDCNRNGILDECEPGGDQDCNNNGVADLCDIFSGWSADVDADAVPDECLPHRYVPGEYSTIQAALDAAEDDSFVVVADGIHSGPGNYDLDFHGRSIRLRSANGPGQCVIDCQGAGRAFTFDDGEGPMAQVIGFTIMNGSSSENGAVYCWSSHPTIRNCLIRDNSGGGVFCDSLSHPTIVRCEIVSNSSRSGAGLSFNRGSNATVRDCTIAGNRATDWDGGGISCYNRCNPRFINCTISGNSASSNGGGVACYLRCAPRFRNCSIIANTSGLHGGAFSLTEYSMLIIQNSTIAENVSDSGGGIGGNGPIVKMVNCVVWGNLPDEIFASPASADVRYSDVRNGWPGAGNIDEDPLFVDPANGDYHLSVGSPCFNAGDPNFVPRTTAIDLDGRSRVMYGRIDMGVDEWALPGDLNCDGAFNGADIDSFFLALGDPAAYGALFPDCDILNGDMNGDGAFNGGDIDPFFACLGGGVCP